MHGFWTSHMLWFGKRENSTAQSRACRDFAKYPELMFLDRFDFVAPLCLGAFLLSLGWLLGRVAPGLHTNGKQMLVRTGDESKNSLILALITLGKGWHNNRHHCANTVRQGFRWWEIDMSFYTLWGFSKMGLVWELKPVPRHLLHDGPEKGGADWTAVPAPVRIEESPFSRAA